MEPFRGVALVLVKARKRLYRYVKKCLDMCLRRTLWGLFGPGALLFGVRRRASRKMKGVTLPTIRFISRGTRERKNLALAWKEG